MLVKCRWYFNEKKFYRSLSKKSTAKQQGKRAGGREKENRSLIGPPPPFQKLLCPHLSRANAEMSFASKSTV